MRSFVFLLVVVAHAYGNTIVSRQSSTSDRQCGTMMCISAMVNGSNVEYVLTSLGKASLGWMAIGFGSQMVNTPMVIMWPNPDGSITLSQRMAPSHVEPAVDPNPPRIASVVGAITSLSGSTPSFGFSIPTDGQTDQQTVIYAFGSTPASSPALDAQLTEHIDKGVLSLNLAQGKACTTGTGAGTGAGSPPAASYHQSFPSNGLPLLPYQRLVIAHGILCTLGFLFFLPTGVLLARYLRTFTPVWFRGHWITQFLVAGPVIVAGIATGIAAVQRAPGDSHFDDIHKRLGLALFILYIIQGSLGAIIHFFKPKKNSGRPIQNYVHAVIGLLLISLAMYQVWYGIKREWPGFGLVDFPRGISILYYTWIVLLSVLFFFGLALLPRQYKQEHSARLRAMEKIYGDDNSR